MKVRLILMNQCITGSRGGGGGTGHFTGSTTGSHFDLRNKDNLLLYQKASPDFFSAKKWLHAFNRQTHISQGPDAANSTPMGNLVQINLNTRFLRMLTVTDLESAPNWHQNQS